MGRSVRAWVGASIRPALRLGLCAVALAIALPPAGAAPGLDFSADERALIASLGPWPPASAADPGNRVSGHPAAVELGRRLFVDPRLSADGTVSCAHCHRPALAFADGRPRAVGLRGAELDRHTPSLWNAGLSRWQGWGGEADSLWSQAIRPLLDPREMGTSAAQVAAVVAGDAELACRHRQAFGREPATDADGAEATLVDAAKALGAYTATLVSGRTAFDRFRDALVGPAAAGSSRSAWAAYPLAAQRGLRLFIGEGRCVLCHGGPTFSHGEFADTGRPYFVRPGVVDPGRAAGIATLRASHYHLLSRWSDAAPDDPATLTTRQLQPQPRNFGEFKVPGLRGVAQSAPYGHDGSLPDLNAVLRHYSELNLDRLHADGEQILRPLGWTAAQRADVIAFLRTLDVSPTEVGARPSPPDRSAAGACLSAAGRTPPR